MTTAEHVRRHRALLGALAVALLVLGAWMAASAYARPVTSHATREVSSWGESSSFQYAVPVTRNSTHWPIGTVLPMGQPAYFRTISDTIQVEHAWLPTLPEGARGVAAGTMIVRVEAQDRDGRPYWAIEHALDEATTDDIAAGLALAGVVDLDALVNEVAVLNKEAPFGDGTLNWSVEATIVYALEGAAGGVRGESVDVLPILAADPRFSLPTAEELAWERPHAEVESISSTAPAGWPGVLRSVRSLALLAAGASLLALLGYAAFAGARNEGFEREYRRHREWVSVAGAIPDAARDPAGIVDVSTLEDLVHVAADARTRVLLDARTREFYALLPGVTYRYARHATTPDG